MPASPIKSFQTLGPLTNIVYIMKVCVISFLAMDVFALRGLTII